ncbi:MULTISPECIES: hypothetical protein [Pseudomonas]|uniref:Uncharacterized protein n=1 Tax=Pseudomonas monachiensis TaxID=3060212 RepID=A0ABW9H9B1_9PSED|nr:MULTISPECIES: hypothetical protein [unclassified Pseudomonas]KRA85441.1 hypothetical protein ASD91_22085 [Pseudomonas sp. Root68]KRB63231.1 hypothetical protein ASD95_20220 [Pseudomonas sp. Root71]
MRDLSGDERTLWGLCFSRVMVKYVFVNTPQVDVEFAANSAANAASALILARRSGEGANRDSFEQRLWDDYAGEAMIKFSTQVRWKLDDYVAVAREVARHAEVAIEKYRGVSGSNLPSFPFDD